MNLGECRKAEPRVLTYQMKSRCDEWNKRQQQRLLKVEVDGTLSLVRSSTSRRERRALDTARIDPAKNFVLRLPNELLMNVFDHVDAQWCLKAHARLIRKAAQPGHECSEATECLRDVLPFPLVCRRWFRIYEGFAYRHIRITKNGQAQRYLRTFKQRPELGVYPQSIYMDFEYMLAATAPMISNICTILALCKNIHGARIIRGDLAFFWDAMFPHFGELRSVVAELKGCSRYMPLCQYLSKHPFRELSLSHLDPHSIFMLDPPESETQRSSENVCKESLASLLLIDHPAPVITKAFISRLASRLTSLKLRSLAQCKYERGIDLYKTHHIQEIIDGHVDSLEELHIPQLSEIQPCLPNFMAFTVLKKLKLSASQLLRTRPSIEYDYLSAPQLRYLAIDYKHTPHEDSNFQGSRRNPADFDLHIPWYKGLADFRKSGKGLSSLQSVSLQALSILHYPDDDAIFGLNREEGAPRACQSVSTVITALAAVGIRIFYRDEEQVATIRAKTAEHKMSKENYRKDRAIEAEMNAKALEICSKSWDRLAPYRHFWSSYLIEPIVLSTEERIDRELHERERFLKQAVPPPYRVPDS